MCTLSIWLVNFYDVRYYQKWLEFVFDIVPEEQVPSLWPDGAQGRLFWVPGQSCDTTVERCHRFVDSELRNLRIKDKYCECFNLQNVRSKIHLKVNNLILDYSNCCSSVIGTLFMKSFAYYYQVLGFHFT